MEDERIKAVKNWPKPMSVRDIQVFIGFDNFYWRFIRGFSRIAVSLTSMLKTTGSSEESAPKAFRAGNNEVVGGGSSRADETVVNLSKNEKSKKLTRVPNVGATREPNFLISDAKKTFNHLRLAFIKAPILQYFDLESHIQIETDALGYAIGGVLSQLNLDSDAPPNDSNSNKSDFGQWHPVAYFSRKMIPAETRYETHDAELLAIVEAFKTWRHYLESCKHEVLVLTDHNNLRRFIDIKSLSSRQVRGAQELSRYHFQIDHRQGKANRAADTLSRFPQRSLNEEEKLRAENTQIFHRLQSSLTRASLSGLSLSLGSNNLSSLHQVLICGTHVLPQLRQFWEMFRTELVDEKPYKASIGKIKLRLAELQELNDGTQKLKATEELQEGWTDIDGVLQHQGLPFVSEIIQTELISRHHDNLLVRHFGINKTRELISRKYYWSTLRKNVEAYVKGCNVCWASKAVRHKPYSNLQAPPVPTYRWKDLLMDFVTGLPVSTDWKDESYDSILVIVDRLT